MILIIGGFAAGKRSYVRENLGYTDADMADGRINERPVVFNAQNLTASMATEALVEALSEKAVVIINEMGAGVIPIQREKREERERAGRLAILLAQRAEKVIRVVCGLPQRLK